MTMYQKRFHSAVQKLKTLPVGCSSWLWVTASGPEGTPFMVLVDVARDPDAEKVQARAEQVVRDSEAAGFAFVGVVRRMSNGALVLSTSEDLDTVTAAMSALGPLAELPTITAMTIRDGQLVRSRKIENRTAVDRQLAALPAGQPAWFGIADGAPSVQFVLGDSQGEVLALLGERAGGAVVGTLQRTEHDTIKAQAPKGQSRQLIAMLQEWGSLEARSWPGLSALLAADITEAKQ